MAEGRGAGASGEGSGGWPALSLVGIMLAGLFVAAALTPSLLPRSPVIQGVLAGTLAAIGHEIGAAAAWLWRFLGFPLPGLDRRARLLWPCAAIGVAAAVWGLWNAADWQNATRAVMGLDPVETGHPAIIAGVGAAVLAALWLLVRAFALAISAAARRFGRVVPPRVGAVLGLAAAGWLFWAAIDGALIRTGFRIADTSFAAAEAMFEPDIARPEDPAATGSAASLVPWEALGRQGRAFVATGPTRAEIAEFAGAGAMQPIRVYVGRNAAPTPAARARLALAELIRAGGFERGTLVVAIPPGTGWMDPGAHDTLDFITGGDVATVGVQYSYLTSILSLVTNAEYGVDQAAALFEAVYDHWTALPRDARPRLYVHGLSQGAYNVQAALPILDLLGDPIQGAFWVGSPFFAFYWRDARENRVPGSPAWRPDRGNGSLVRTLTQDGPGAGPYAPWGPMRLVFLNYGSDPIVQFSVDALWRRPDLLGPDRPRDVSPAMRWFPVVTGFQLGLDSAISLQVPGYGHYYIAEHYIDGWATLLDPPGWNADRAAALKAIFARRPAAF